MPFPNPFASKSKKPAAAADAAATAAGAVRTLTDTVDAMEQREAALRKRIDGEVAAAKAAVGSGNRNQALLCMKRKKLYEDTLRRQADQRTNLEAMQMTVEDSSMNARVLAAQRAAGEALAAINASMEAESIDDIMDSIREAVERQQEIGAMLAQSTFGDMVMDDDEAEDELRLLLAAPATSSAVAHTAAAGRTTEPALPSVPKTALDDPDAAALAELEDELERLEAA